MKISIRKTYREAVLCANNGEKVVPFGDVFAIVPEKDYFKFLSTMTDNHTTYNYHKGNL